MAAIDHGLRQAHVKQLTMTPAVSRWRQRLPRAVVRVHLREVIYGYQIAIHSLEIPTTSCDESGSGL